MSDFRQVDSAHPMDIYKYSNLAGTHFWQICLVKKRGESDPDI